MSCNFTASTNKYKVDLVLQIYMKLPQSLTNLTFSGGLLDTSSVSIYSNTSGVDTISHFLLLALASTQHGRNWTDQMREFEAAARKLAATHPLLLLRNLPLLAAGMKGRTDFDFSFFRYAFIISKWWYYVMWFNHVWMRTILWNVSIIQITLSMSDHATKYSNVRTLKSNPIYDACLRFRFMIPICK